MVEVVGSEFQIKEIVGYVSMLYRSAFYRKTTDSNGDDYFLILNADGEEVAEWDDVKNDWILIQSPRQTENTLNTTDITGMYGLIEKQRLHIALRMGRFRNLFQSRM